jgi:hypothetical protein
VGGATLFGTTTHVKIVDQPSWITRVPVEKNEDEKRAEAQGVLLWPRESHCRVCHELTIGTVAELVEHYREQLTRAFNTFAMLDLPADPCGWTATRATDNEAGLPIIPTFGTTDFVPKNECLARNGITACVTMESGETELQAREADRSKQRGGPMRQDGVTRDLLMKLVSNWTACRRKSNQDDGPTSPTACSASVSSLIAALTILKEDQANFTKSSEKAPGFSHGDESRVDFLS